MAGKSAWSLNSEQWDRLREIRLMRVVERIMTDGTKRKHVATVRPQDDTQNNGILTVHDTLDASGKLQQREGYVEILSEPLQALLRSALEGYPETALESTPYKFRYPYHSLVHRHKEIAKHAAKAASSSQENKHARHVLKFIYDQLRDEVEAFESAQDFSIEVSFSKLWTCFVPGQYVVQRDLGHYEDCYQIVGMRYTPVPKEDIQNQLFLIHARQIQFSDSAVSYSRSVEYPCRYFDGTKRISTLDWIPLQARQDWEKFRNKKVEDGKEWWKIIRKSQHHHCRYNAIAFTNDPLLFPEKDTPFFDSYRVYLYEARRQEFKAYPIRGEIIVDQAAFLEINPYEHIFPASEIANIKSKEDFQLTDELALIAPARLPGFALDEKVWAYFQVSEVKEIQWSERAFEELQIEPDSKLFLRDLITAHQKETVAEGNDVIPGKGNGLIFLLHGAPGTGKTFTAQALAHFTHKPLYATTSGELSKNKSLERNLRDALHWSQRWKAIFLLDEADVFLARRDIVGDMKRNETVTIFLQQIEYTSGIIFLSTNRVGDFDRAIMSRVHLAIQYDGLSNEQRKAIWGFRLQRYSKIDDKDLEKLTQEGDNLSGRDIRIIVHMAQQLEMIKPNTIDLNSILKLVSKRQQSLTLCENASPNVTEEKA